jgi:hypothetical protein
MADGTVKSMKDLKPGDRVVTLEPGETMVIEDDVYVWLAKSPEVKGEFLAIHYSDKKVSCSNPLVLITPLRHSLCFLCFRAKHLVN